MTRSLRASALALACTLAACGGGGGTVPSHVDTSPVHDPAGCPRVPGHQEIAGELVDIPKMLPVHPPLLVAFHGLHESADYLAGETGFDDVAAKHGFLVAYPNALRGQRWQLSRRDGNGDVAHIRSFIKAVVTRLCADPRRVYLTGFSNGAGFAYRAGCALAGQVAAIAPVSGSYRTQDPCPAGTRAMPALEIHGRDPWTATVPKLIAQTTTRNGCDVRPRTHHPSPGVTRTIWPGCDVQRIYNRNIGHEWPKLGPYNTSEVVWSFVSRFPR